MALDFEGVEEFLPISWVIKKKKKEENRGWGEILVQNWSNLITFCLVTVCFWTIKA